MPIYAKVPPRVEYRLSAFGETLAPILKALEAWGRQYLDTLSALRSADD